MARPKTIFKYEPFTERTLRNLKSQCIYFSSPLNFNDPYDCATSPGFLPLSDDDVVELRSRYLTDTKTSPEIRQQFETAELATLKQLFIGSAMRTIAAEMNRIVKNRGFSCFSERNNDLLMWAHYGGGYRGFCLEFSTDFEPFLKMKPVIYQSNMPMLDLRRILLDEDFEEVLNLFRIKSKSWAYEEEWRIIHDKAGTEYCYEAGALKAVYFGPDIDLQSMEIVCLILSGQHPDVEFWRGARSNNEFKVDFEEFTYTSFAEAKKLGLKS